MFHGGVHFMKAFLHLCSTFILILGAFTPPFTRLCSGGKSSIGPMNDDGMGNFRSNITDNRDHQLVELRTKHPREIITADGEEGGGPIKIIPSEIEDEIFSSTLLNTWSIYNRF